MHSLCGYEKWFRPGGPTCGGPPKQLALPTRGPKSPPCAALAAAQRGAGARSAHPSGDPPPPPPLPATRLLNRRMRAPIQVVRGRRRLRPCTSSTQHEPVKPGTALSARACEGSARRYEPARSGAARAPRCATAPNFFDPAQRPVRAGLIWVRAGLIWVRHPTKKDHILICSDTYI